MNGYVELPLILEITAAPELAGLLRWAKQRASYETCSSPFPSRRRNRPSFWSTVAAVVLGWGIGEALFGDDG